MFARNPDPAEYCNISVNINKNYLKNRMRKVEKREKIENIGKDFTHFTNVGHFHNW